MRFILPALLLLTTAATADEVTFTRSEAEALYRLGFAEAAAQIQLKPIQDAAKSALDKLKAPPPDPAK